jgi:formylglycine-generating enzyme required for sulfatase activity
LDENAEPTTDVSKVEGFRLPTEAEWEYAAREGGRKVRFGNGKDTARTSEINLNAKRTMPVGSYQPNSLGLYDMSGNAWEWVSDTYAKYQSTDQVNPYVTAGKERMLRGGMWSGDASEARVFRRTRWPRNDRCNNSGFRIARSAN